MISGRRSLADAAPSVAAAALALVVGACTAAGERPRDLLAFEPGEAPAEAMGPKLGIDSPLSQICAVPGGRALIEREAPGLIERPEYPMFSHMSLVRLQRLSGGRITERSVAQVAAGLRSLAATAKSTPVSVRAGPPPPAGLTTIGSVAP